MTATQTSSRSNTCGAVRADVYARVTERIVTALETGTRPWVQPWRAEQAGPLAMPQRHNGTPYRGINVLLLWGEAIEHGYQSSTWMTYKQAQALGGQVRKGEHGALVVFANQYTKKETDDQGDEVARDIHFMKGYTVFNVDQIDELPAMYRPTPVVHGEPLQRIEAAEQFFRHTGAVFQEGGHHAFYAPGPDIIRLPPTDVFRDAASYTATKAHELVHWSGHTSRLARDFGAQRFGDEGYAIEELVAELGAAFLCADLGVTDEPRPDHAAYLASWLRALKNDKRLIFSAAAHAQRAADFLHSLQPATTLTAQAA
ncbi:MAG: antirestriction protein [Pseudomonadota bacterium]|jgi:antirestriction protein ArdC